MSLIPMVTVRWTFKAVCVSVCVCVCGSDKYISKHEHVARHSASVSAYIVQQCVGKVVL